MNPQTHEHCREYFIQINARSLYHKVDELDAFCTSLPKLPLFIAVCETWARCDGPHPDPDPLFSFQSYSILRRDRPGRSGGGVMLYFHPSLATSLCHRHDLQSSEGEDLWAEVQLPGLGKVVLACVYRPPLTDRTSIQSFLTSLEHSLRLVSSERCPVLIAGDFNFKHSQWCASDRTDYGGESLQYVLDAYGYHQLVDFPTRVRQNSLKSCLDLVLTSRWPCVPTITSSAPIGHSDHVTLLGTIQLPSKNTSQSSHSAAVSNTRYVPVWSVEHTDRLNSAIQRENWTDILQSGDINQAWVCWKAKILSLVNETLPQKRIRNARRSQPWITPALRQEIKLKHKLFRQYLKSKTPDNWEKFKKQRNAVSSSTRRAKCLYVAALSEDSGDTTSNIQKFGTDGQLHRRDQPKPSLFQLTRALLGQGTRTPIPPLLLNSPHPGNTSASTDLEKAETLNCFFIKQSQQSADCNNMPALGELSDAPLGRVPSQKLDSLIFSEADVFSILRKLDIHKASGSDGISLRLLKFCAPSISQHLATSVAFHLAPYLVTGLMQLSHLFTSAKGPAMKPQTTGPSPC